MASSIHINTSIANSPQTAMLEEHFAKIAFAVSAVVLLILQPLSFLFGTAAGFLLHYTFEPNPIVHRSEEIITATHATLALIAAISALVRLTPGGEAGGWIFQTVTPLFAIAIGSSAYLGFRWFLKDAAP